MDVVFITSDICCKLNFLMQCPILTSGFFICERGNYPSVDELLLTGKEIGGEVSIDSKKVHLLEGFFNKHRNYTVMGFDTYPCEVERRDGPLESNCYFSQMREIIDCRISADPDYRHVFFTSHEKPMLIGQKRFILGVSNYDTRELRSNVRNYLLKEAHESGMTLERGFFAEF